MCSISCVLLSTYCTSCMLSMLFRFLAIISKPDALASRFLSLLIWVYWIWSCLWTLAVVKLLVKTLAAWCNPSMWTGHNFSDSSAEVAKDCGQSPSSTATWLKWRNCHLALVRCCTDPQLARSKRVVYKFINVYISEARRRQISADAATSSIWRCQTMLGKTPLGQVPPGRPLRSALGLVWGLRWGDLARKCPTYFWDRGM